MSVWYDEDRSSLMWTPRNMKLLTLSTAALSMWMGLGMVSSLQLPVVHNELLSFADVELEVVVMAPC